ncbi:MAG: ribosome-binding factor A [Lentisphaerae bacterium RIFOXYB12_FULL_60_10]|nr:MAG: ribosome-binding factor A [Lentisphaerae bacterium RIFOXYA12_FULL_60_10]OGV79935.1 MAG: ribosome-binding factor A [Lentisphaerae bacterium RIFOXYB12_FULL_60_10]
MTVDRVTRLNEIVKREISESIFRLIPENEMDHSAITVVRVIMSRSLQHARVMISIRDHKDERPHILGVLRHYRHEIQKQINRNLHLKYTPKLIFQIDPSIEKGDTILGILSHLDTGPGDDDNELSESGAPCQP